MSRDIDALKHIAVYITDVESFIQDYSYESFVNDRKTMQAVCYAVLNIGELSKEISDDIKSRHASIPWKQIKGMRDRAAHGYHFISSDIVWDVVHHDIPKLKIVVNDEINRLSSRNEIGGK